MIFREQKTQHGSENTSPATRLVVFESTCMRSSTRPTPPRPLPEAVERRVDDFRDQGKDEEPGAGGRGEDRARASQNQTHVRERSQTTNKTVVENAHSKNRAHLSKCISISTKSVIVDSSIAQPIFLLALTLTEPPAPMFDSLAIWAASAAT